MTEVPWSGPSEPYETTLGHAHFANGVLIATLKLPDQAELGDAAGKPAILFHFGHGSPGCPPKMWPPLVLTFGEDDDPEALVRLVTSAVADLPRVAAFIPPESPPPPADTHCPGCGVKLHGAVAERGGCLACFPTIPGDEGRHG